MSKLVFILMINFRLNSLIKEELSAAQMQIDLLPAVLRSIFFFIVLVHV